MDNILAGCRTNRKISSTDSMDSRILARQIRKVSEASLEKEYMQGIID
jgi:hypothetical protein